MIGSIKICGISTAETFDCSAAAGATHIGFNFFPNSPRFITISTAVALAARASTVAAVALTVDASDDVLDEIVSKLKPEILQLHGSETKERVTHLKSRWHIQVMKALAISDEASLDKARQFDGIADFLLFDAPPGALPGGNGATFEWSLLSQKKWRTPWFLSGGLTPDNVAEGIYQTKAPGVDVSSGVESARGIKDCARINNFISRAQSAFNAIADV